jgi:uncharacterized protein YbjT (DUF2867 family)
VLVLGGAGFIGRHAVAALIARKVDILIGSRQPLRIDRRLPPSAHHCPRIEVHFEDCLTPDAWQTLITDVDVVLNCVGILRQRGAATYARVHLQAPKALAIACARAGKRLVHVSALGLDPSAKSRFLTSKLAGENAIKQSQADWIIARPSLLDGEGGYGAWWLRRVAKLPVFAMPADARGKIAALDVADLGEALTKLCIADSRELDLDVSREFDLGGEHALTLENYLRVLRSRFSERAALRIPVPSIVARVVAHLCDLLHATPFSFGHWELLRRDNLPSDNRLPELLGRAPKPIAKR